MHKQNLDSSIKRKPVWRVSTGNPPPKNDSLYPYNIICANGNTSKASMCVDFSFQDQPDDVVAYQTTRTREAKYKKVECLECDYFKDWLDCDCQHCNGKGYILKEINHAN